MWLPLNSFHKSILLLDHATKLCEFIEHFHKGDMSRVRVEGGPVPSNWLQPKGEGPSLECPSTLPCSNTRTIRTRTT